MENIDNEIEQIEVTLENGEKVFAEVLFTFEANGDEFIMYAIGEDAFGAKMDQEGNLQKIEEDEWKLIEPIFNDYLEEEENDD